MAFATVEQVQTRMGRLLTDLETDATEFLIDAATEMVAAAVGQPSATLDSDATPMLRYVTVEVVCRALANPQGLRSETEQLGSFQHSQSYKDGDGSTLLLTAREESVLRQVVIGRDSGSSRPESTATELYDVYAGS